MRNLRLVLAAAVLFFSQIATWESLAAPENAGDIIKGIVIDAETGEPLIGAAILVSNTTEGVITDLDGTFAVNLLRENTPLEVSYIGYKTVPFSIETSSGSIELVVSQEYASIISLNGNTLSITMQPDGEMLENAVVTGRKNLESLQALRNERITSGFAIENIGAGEMSIKGLSNAQESVTKMSGISVADAGQLIVRGLGDRYSTTTLNGLPIASPNPDNKLIPLDIFPASTIQNITVSKVYEVSSYADYSGAHVDISTKEGKSEDFFNVSFSTGGYFNTFAAGSYRTMDCPSLFVTPRIDAAADNIKYSEFAQYSRNNEIFSTGFSTSRKTVMPDLDGSIGWGKTLTFGTHDLSILATASVKSGDEIYRNAFYRSYEASSSGNMMSNYNYDSYTRKLDIAGLVNLQYTFKESDNLSFTIFYARNAKNTHLDRTGYDYLETLDLIGRNQVSHFYKLQDYQLAGHHDFDRSWLLDWGVSASFTNSDEPDRRQVMFERLDDGTVTFYDEKKQETNRYFGRLAENEYVANAKATHAFDDKGNKIDFGLSAKYKTRNFGVTRFEYDLLSYDEPLADLDNLDQWFAFDKVSGGIINIDRKKHNRDKYDAYSVVGAAFVETDLKFGRKWSLNAGFRAEMSRQNVAYSTDVEKAVRNLDAIDIFPAVNLRYDVTPQHFLRLSLSRTITRPSFVEMAPFLYQESFGGAQIIGNQYLENGYNYNVDLKYEFFRDNSDDMFAVTGYYKYLENPIERTQRVKGGATEHSFENAERGLAAGVELEFRKTIIENLLLSANASYMYTDVKLPAGGVYTNMQRNLQGASPYLVNVDLSYTPEFRNGSSLTAAILYNLQGPRIQAVGIMGLGDVMQRPFHSLDFNFSYKFDEHFSVSLSLNNLLDSPMHLVQDIPNADRTVDVEKWRIGRGFGIGIGYSL